MIPIFKLMFLLLFLIVCIAVADEKWWPEKCNTADTIINKSDTVVVKYKCKKNGRKEILRVKNGKYNGMYTAWSSNGKKIEEFSYHEDEFDGEMNGWDTTGFLITHRSYIDGKPIGFHQDYYSKSKPKNFVHYNDSGKKHGLCETWHEDGTRKDSTVYENGFVVETRQYFFNGKISSYVKSPNNKLLEAYAWDPKGRQLETIKNGNGGGRNYSEDGKTVYWCEYKDGEENGIRELKPGEPVPSVKK